MTYTLLELNAEMKKAKAADVLDYALIGRLHLEIEAEVAFIRECGKVDDYADMQRNQGQTLDQ